MNSPDERDAARSVCRFGMRTGILTLAGVLLSGPVALALVAALGPQPGGESATLFAAHDRSIQRVP